MQSRRFILFIVLFCLLFSLKTERLVAQSIELPNISAGLFNSTKGFGLCFDRFISGSHIDSYSFFLDLQGILDGCSSSPGIRARYNYNMPFFDRTFDKGGRCLLYSGPGITMGYVRDTNNRIGFMCGVSGVFGCTFLFDSRFSLSLNIEASVAFHLRDDAYINVYDFKFFQAGVVNAYMPELRIAYYW